MQNQGQQTTMALNRRNKALRIEIVQALSLHHQTLTTTSIPNKMANYPL